MSEGHKCEEKGENDSINTREVVAGFGIGKATKAYGERRKERDIQGVGCGPRCWTESLTVSEIKLCLLLCSSHKEIGA